jgi:D-inositol-3-phosphate glycosyltransferase
VAQGVDRVISLSESEREHLVRLYGVDGDRVAVIPGGVDLEICRPLDREQCRKELGLSPDARVVLYVGRMDPLKGIDTLVQALSLIPEGVGLQCLVVGGNTQDDGQIAGLISLAEGLGVAGRMKFFGPVEHERVPLFYSAADVCVVPSRYESFGLVALESLACGTPVVASEVGGLPSIVRHMENGLLVSQPDPASFAAAMMLLLGDGVLRQRLASGAVASARSFYWPGIRQEVLRQYNMLKGCVAAGRT